MSQEYAAPIGVTGPGAAVETHDKAPYSLFAKMSAEFFGTFLLVLGIVGTATFNALNQGSIVTVALGGGIMLIAGIAAVGHISGGHFNPAVTFGAAIAGRLPWKDVLPYWLAQFLGAAFTALVLWFLVPPTFPALLGVTTRGDVLGRTANGWGAHSPLATASQNQSHFSLEHALVIEVIIAAVFVGVVLAVTSSRSKITFPAVVIGLTLGALHIISWPVTNTSFNPARSFASVLFAGDSGLWSQYWLFFVAPLVGGALAALICRAYTPFASTTDDDVLGQDAGPYALVPDTDEFNTDEFSTGEFNTDAPITGAPITGGPAYTGELSLGPVPVDEPEAQEAPAQKAPAQAAQDATGITLDKPEDNKPEEQPKA